MNACNVYSIDKFRPCREVRTVDKDVWFTWLILLLRFFFASLTIGEIIRRKSRNRALMNFSNIEIYLNEDEHCRFAYLVNQHSTKNCTIAQFINLEKKLSATIFCSFNWFEIIFFLKFVLLSSEILWFDFNSFYRWNCATNWTFNNLFYHFLRIHDNSAIAHGFVFCSHNKYVN